MLGRFRFALVCRFRLWNWLPRHILFKFLMAEPKVPKGLKYGKVIPRMLEFQVPFVTAYSLDSQAVTFEFEILLMSFFVVQHT